MEQWKQQGREAFKRGEVRLAPIAVLLAQGEGFGPLDAWYQGYDEARGHGPYLHGRVAEAA